MATRRANKGASAAAAYTDADDVKPAAPAAAASAGFRYDVLCVAALLALAAATRFWNIHDPRSIIFDEAHFNKFTTWYISQHYYVDIHPPLAKLVFAAVLRLVGFVGAQEEKIRWWVGADEGGFIGTKDWLLLYEEEWGLAYLPLRRTSAVVGTLFVAATFLTCRAIGMGRIAALFAAWLAMLECVILVQSRAILCDIFLYFFNVATIGATFASARAGQSERARVAWCAVTGLLLGCAMSVKLTALGTMAVVGVHQTMTLFGEERGAWGAAALARTAARGAVRAAAILVPAAGVFFGLWILHLDILKYSGQGDNFMIPEFQRTLQTKPPRGRAAPPPDACPNPHNQWSDCGHAGISEAQCLDKGCCWDPTSTRAWCYHLGRLERPSMPLIPKLYETLRATWANNNGGAVMEHPFMSQWWEWPVMDASTVPFAATSTGGQIKALGNPAVWLGVFGNFVAVTGFLALVAARLLASGGAAGFAPAGAAHELNARGWATPFVTLWSGYLLNLVPYQLIKRSKFVYHYVPALMVGVLLYALALDAVWAAARGSGSPAARRAAALLTALLFASVAAGFWYWGLPYAYGMKISAEQNAARKWNSKW